VSLIVGVGALTSRSKIAAPVSLRWASRVEACRPVAITRSPLDRTLWTNCSPKPEEQPVTSQISRVIAVGTKGENRGRLWQVERNFSESCGLTSLGVTRNRETLKATQVKCFCSETSLTWKGIDA